MKVELSKDEIEAFEAITKYVIKSNGTMQLMASMVPGIDQFLSIDQIMEANVLVATCHRAIQRIKKEENNEG